MELRLYLLIVTAVVCPLGLLWAMTFQRDRLPLKQGVGLLLTIPVGSSLLVLNPHDHVFVLVAGVLTSIGWLVMGRRLAHHADRVVAVLDERERRSKSSPSVPPSV